MASINTVLRAITTKGIAVTITCSGDDGSHILNIRSNSDTAFQWNYEYTQPSGDTYRYNTDDFLHNENVHGAFDEDNIMHVSAMAMIVKEKGRHFPVKIEDVLTGNAA